MFFSFALDEILALNICKPTLSAGNNKFIVAVFLEGEKETFSFATTEFPCEMVKSAVVALSPAYCKNTSTGNLFL
ncbi:hypothetical protein D3C85_1738720 [compost metagenome]